MSVLCSPQALFGVIPEPGALPDKSKQAPSERPPHHIPDFARLIIFSGPEGKSRAGSGMTAPQDIVDFYELKALNSTGKWTSASAKGDAEKEIRRHLEQLYDESIAGFAHNKDWKQLYAVLVIGAYFSQVVWKRPSDDILEPIIPAEVPKTLKPDVNYQASIKRLLNDISRYEARPLPEILLWNEPVFVVKDGSTEPKTLSLSPAFLWALDRPIRAQFPQLIARSTLFGMPRRKPGLSQSRKTAALRVFKEVLITDHIEMLQNYARSLGHRFDGDPEATPTPPNSLAEKPFKGSVKVQDLPRAHMKTRNLKRNKFVKDDDGVDEAEQ